MFDINNLIRDNIKALTAYSSARDEFKGDTGIFLDANENPFNAPYNRYPDPLQWKVKEKLAAIKNVAPEQIFLGNGSDEAIDLVIRAFCEPRKENIVSMHPSYGMYQVAAEINAVEFRKVPLTDDFSLDTLAICKAVDRHTKLIMLCSPNNPTANSLNASDIISLLNWFTGLIVVDEAYIDFSTHPGLLPQLSSYPNLIILQTFSKAWGLAGLRMGIAFASESIIRILNKIKYPYNVNMMTQQMVLQALDDVKGKENRVSEILLQRDTLVKNLKGLKLIRKIYPTDANFALVKVDEPRKVYEYLIDRQIIIRDRSKVKQCEGCLRITVGTRNENEELLNALKQYEKEFMQ